MFKLLILTFNLRGLDSGSFRLASAYFFFFYDQSKVQTGVTAIFSCLNFGHILTQAAAESLFRVIFFTLKNLRFELAGFLFNSNFLCRDVTVNQVLKKSGVVMSSSGGKIFNIAHG